MNVTNDNKMKDKWEDETDNKAEWEEQKEKTTMNVINGNNKGKPLSKHKQKINKKSPKIKFEMWKFSRF